MDAKPIIKVEHLIKNYGEKRVVQGIDFEVKKGEILCFLGPNGAGKSTTINILSGILGYETGTIRYKEQDVKKHLKEFKSHMGVVPQELAIYEDLSAEQNVRFFASLYGLGGKDLEEKVKKSLDFVGLLERRKDKAKTFSGGMKRRLNIACAIAHEPELLIMDEPTVGIDPQSRNHILEAVRKLGDRGTTVIYTTHYMEEVQSLCSRILIMDAGHIIADGKVEDLIKRLNFEEKTHIKVRSIDSDLIQNLKCIDGIKEVLNEGNKITLLSQNEADNLEDIIKIAQGYGIKSIHSEIPTLEDVFLTLTGKTLRDEEV